MYRLEADSRGKDRRYVMLPFGAQFNYTDNPNRPKKGMVVGFDLKAYSTIFEKLRAFTQANIDTQIFIPLMKDKKVFTKLWGDIGLSPGTGKTIVPKD